MSVELNATISSVLVEGTDSSKPNGAAPENADLSLMPQVNQLACSGDPGAMLAALTMKAAKSEREAARAQRENAERAQEGVEAAEIQDLRSKADLMRVQGIVDGALQVGQGLCDLGSGLESAKAAGQKADNDLKGAAKSDAWAVKLKSVGEFCGAAEKIADGYLQGAITDKDTDAKAHDMQAQSFKKIGEDANDDQKDAKELMAKAMEFYKDYTETKAQTMLAATHRA